MVWHAYFHCLSQISEQILLIDPGTLSDGA